MGGVENIYEQRGLRFQVGAQKLRGRPVRPYESALVNICKTEAMLAPPRSINGLP